MQMASNDLPAPPADLPPPPPADAMPPAPPADAVPPADAPPPAPGALQQASEVSFTKQLWDAIQGQDVRGNGALDALGQPSVLS
ncbi:hypothetical protein AWC23_13745 [Mycobacterium saskatchewanense]|uniref:Resuscitation-promoting factor RpfA n=1 Tax=Mycobacterium saskatchewanense TaxID=220927 RepID=A0AAJ3NR42_9MYCO|nr:hypothetical protein AWC23_13745 [Mycobacterium saskatchewanense]